MQIGEETMNSQLNSSIIVTLAFIVGCAAGSCREIRSDSDISGADNMRTSQTVPNSTS
jgi:hypothetical protein